MLLICWYRCVVGGGDVVVGVDCWLLLSVVVVVVNCVCECSIEPIPNTAPDARPPTATLFVPFKSFGHLSTSPELLYDARGVYPHRHPPKAAREY